MILSTYNPNCTATCPKCGVVECQSTGGNLITGRRYMDLYHEVCNTRWTVPLDKQTMITDRKEK